MEFHEIHFPDVFEELTTNFGILSYGSMPNEEMEKHHFP